MAESVVVAVVIADRVVLGNTHVVPVLVASVADALAVNEGAVVGTVGVGSGVAVAVVASDVSGSALAGLAIEVLVLLAAALSLVLLVESGNPVDELGWLEGFSAGLGEHADSAAGDETDFAGASVSCPVGVGLGRTVLLYRLRL